MDMTKESDQGYVYILTNPSFKEDWVKIGKSSRPVDVRSKELDNTAVPLPFEVFATLKTKKYNEVEKLVHKTIDRLTSLRIRQNREFFNVDPFVALDILKDIATTLDDAEIDIVNQEAKSIDSTGEVCEHKRQKPNFKFSMIGIQVGETITFTPTGQTVKVASENTIEFEGRIYTLSNFASTFMPDDKRNTSDAYRGPKFFSYNGKLLTELRDEMELFEE